MTKTPILFIIFNRLDTVRQSFEPIRRYKPEKLYIAADGPRKNKEGEVKRCQEVREWVLGNIDWECKVSTLFRDENVGCGQGPKQAIDWLFANEEMGVILEDDCVASDSFFEFACQMLVKYRDDKRISIICGSNFDKNGDFRVKDADYFLSVVPYTWGWATWRRNWEDYEFDAVVIDDSMMASMREMSIRERVERMVYNDSDCFIRDKYVKRKRVFSR